MASGRDILSSSGDLRVGELGVIFVGLGSARARGMRGLGTVPMARGGKRVAIVEMPRRVFSRGYSEIQSQEGSD